MRPNLFSADSPGVLAPTVSGTMAFVPNPAPRQLPLSGAVVRALARAQHSLGAVGGAAGRLVNPFLVSSSLLRQEALLSSRIEGTIATPEQLALFELDIEQPTPDAREIGNFVRATEFALTRLAEGAVIAGPLLRAAHRLLMTDVRGDRERPGEYRDAQNFIGATTDIREARFVPPPHLRVPGLLADLERYLHDEEPEVPDLVRVAIAHYQFEAIHPFRDGNGRIGRLLIVLLLVRDGLLPGPFLPISSAFERRRKAYADHLLRVSTHGDWEGWLLFFLESVDEAALLALRQIDALAKLRAEWHGRFQSARSSALLLKLVDSLFQRPAITIARAGEILQVTPASASASLGKLAAAGILTEITGRTRNRIYVARELLAVIGTSGERR